MAGVLDMAVAAMTSEVRRVEAAANNITGASAPGHKRAVAFAVALDRIAAIAQPTDGAAVQVQLATDFSQGRLNQTGDARHFALDGPGFFEVRAGDRLLYTRAGQFLKDERGRLVTPQGWVLQGQGGDVSVRGEDFRVERDGTILEGASVAGRLRLVEFADRSQLTRIEAGAFAAGSEPAVDSTTTTVRQGFVEVSNAAGSTEYVALMEAMRRFEFGQRIFHVHDDMLEKVFRRLGDLQ